MAQQTLSDRITALERTLYGSLTEATVKQAPPPYLALGNPAPLGLLGFATASLLTAVMKISSDETAKTTGTFAATAIFMGGLAQVLTAIFSLLQNHTHAATAFGLYGFHWLTAGVQIWMSSTTENPFTTTSPLPLATYSGVLAVMSLFLFLPTLRMNAVLSGLFIALTLVFLTEIPAAYGVRPAEVISGVIQGIAGSLGAYLAMLDLVNEAWRKQIFPLFPHREHQKDYDTFDEGYVPRKMYHKSAVSSIHA